MVQVTRDAVVSLLGADQ